MSLRVQALDLAPHREPPLRYERLGHHHIEALLEIEIEAYPDPWTRGMFRQELVNPASRFFVAYEGERLVGYGGFWFVVDEAHITKLTVIPACRRRGLGEVLLRFLLSESTQVGATTARLEVRESNEPARHLYDRLGFTEVGIRKGYYRRTGEAAVVMVKTLC